MANYLSIELTGNELVAAFSRSSNRRLQIEKAFCFSIDDTNNNHAIGEQLKDAIADQGFSRCDVIAVVGRSDVEMRELQTPPAPADELPELVKFLARNEFGSLNEQWSIDFVPFTEDADQPREVLAVAVPPELLSQLTTICEVAGLKLKHFTYRPFAIVNLLRSRCIDGSGRVIVDCRGNHAELTMVKGTQLLTSRRVVAASGEDTAERADKLTKDIRRTIASAAKRMDGAAPTEVLVLGTGKENQQLASDLAERLELNGSVVDPFDLAPTKASLTRPTGTQNYAAVLGNLLQQDSGLGHEIDFVNPRQKVTKKMDFRRPLLFGGVAAAAALMACFAGWWMLSSQKSEIARLNDTLNRQLDMNEGKIGGLQKPSVNDIIGETQKVDSWVQGDVMLLDVLENISDRMLTPDDVILNSFSAKTLGNELSVRLEGYSAGDDASTKLKRQLSEIFHVIPQDTKKIKNKDYAQSLEFQMSKELGGQDVIQRMTEKAREWIQQSTASTNPAEVDAETTTSTSDSPPSESP